MLSNKSKLLFVTVCLLETVWLLLAQVVANVYVLFPCLVCFLALTVWTAIKGMVIPTLLYFLPFAPLLKMQPGAISFYTIALLTVYLVYIVMGSKKINVYHLIPGLVLIALILVEKTLYGDAVNASFVVFSASILLAPFLTRELSGKYDFFWLTLMFSLGIVLAAITSQYLSVFPTITRYIRQLSLFGVVRHSGYYGDPNFYSTHITAALGGVMVILLNNRKKSRIVPLILLMTVLFYCGFLSVSKSFFLVAACLVLFWFLEFMFKRGKLTVKLTILLALMIGVVFLLSFTVFTDLINMMISRLSSGSNLSDFTTGRIELWAQYMHAFDEDPILLLFGKGYIDVLINGRGSHNTVIQVVYQLGIVGSVLLIAWAVCCVRTLLAGAKIQRNNIVQVFIVLIGACGPWLALDFLFFDEFFLIPLYVCFAIRYLTESAEQQSA